MKRKFSKIKRKLVDIFDLLWGCFSLVLEIKKKKNEKNEKRKKKQAVALEEKSN